MHTGGLSDCVSIPKEVNVLTSTRLPSVSGRTISSLFRSHSSTFPSEDADRRALKDLDTANMVTADLWPNRQILGCKSTESVVVTTVQTEIVQSEPAVTRVLESANKT